MRAQSIRAGFHALAVTAALLGLTLPAQADTAGAVNCLQTNLISSTRVVDDQTILFKTRGNQWYKNQLPHKCAGLKSEGKFRYKTSISKLCNVDVITVLHGSGANMMDGASCGLGMFVPTDAPASKPKEK
jgi:hypothetical protein